VHHLQRWRTDRAHGFKSATASPQRCVAAPAAVIATCGKTRIGDEDIAPGRTAPDEASFSAGTVTSSVTSTVST